MTTVTRHVRARDSLAAVRKCPKTFRGKRMVFVRSKKVGPAVHGTRGKAAYELTFKERIKRKK